MLLFLCAKTFKIIDLNSSLIAQPPLISGHVAATDQKIRSCFAV